MTKLNPNVIHSHGELGVPRSKKGPRTRAQSPDLNTSRRNEQRQVSLNSRIEEKRSGSQESKHTPPHLEDTTPVRPIAPSKPTQPHSPQFRLKRRYEIRLVIRQATQKLEEEKQKAKREFKAKAKPRSHLHPFIPKPSNNPVTTPQDHSLHTKHRSLQRKQFDESQQLRLSQIEETKKFLEQQQREEDRRAIRRRRQNLIPRATPMPSFSYKPILPIPTALTLPQSPALSTRGRSRISMGVDMCVTKIRKDIKKRISRKKSTSKKFQLYS
ncbi:hypothetical protein GEMRC1_012717 [Eukaryota sp. GEM-RC1]